MIAHAGEIGIKSKTTRRFMIKTLYQNISFKFPDFDLKFKNISNRTIIYTDRPYDLAKGIAEIIFGASHVAPIYLFSWSTYEELLTICTQYSSQFMKSGHSFGYAARSSGPNHPPSQQLKVDLGSKLWETFDGKITVNLTNPDFLFTVEVRNSQAWIYHETFLGPDGFPPGVQQGVIYANIRFWLADYIAAFLVLKRGVKVKLVRFLTTSTPSTDQEGFHSQFLEKFVFKKAIDVPIYEALASWKDVFGDNLCSACMLFSESLLSLASKNKSALGFTSGVSLSSPYRDITPEGLQWLEQNNKGFKIRPNLFSSLDSSQHSLFFENFPKTFACCSFQSQRLIKSPIPSDQIHLINQSVQEFAEKYFGTQASNQDDETSEDK